MRLINNYSFYHWQGPARMQMGHTLSPGSTVTR